MAKIKKAATFNQGFETTEYLASALVDMRYHTIDPTGLDADAFERETLAELNMPDEIVMRHRSPHFGHIFSSEGYSAGYYGYMWADVLTADAAEAFERGAGRLLRQGDGEEAWSTTCSRSATPSTRPMPTAPSAAATPMLPRSCAPTAFRSQAREATSGGIVRVRPAACSSAERRYIALDGVPTSEPAVLAPATHR